MYDNNKFSDLSLGIKPHLDLELESIGGISVEKKISKATMSRFPVYLKALRKMQHGRKRNMFISELFEITGIQDTTIRRDFTYLSKTDNFGRRGRGYDVKHLIDGLSEVLGLRLDEPIILIRGWQFRKCHFKI